MPGDSEACAAGIRCQAAHFPALPVTRAKKASDPPPVEHRDSDSVPLVTMACETATPPTFKVVMASGLASVLLGGLLYRFDWLPSATPPRNAEGSGFERSATGDRAARTPEHSGANVTSVKITGALRTASGLYFCAEFGGGGVINANRDVRGIWEDFDIFVVGPAADNRLPETGRRSEIERLKGTILDGRRNRDVCIQTEVPRRRVQRS